MKNNWFSRNSKFYPLITLIAFSVVQYLHAQQSLQRYQEYADRNNEILDKRMLRDNVPSNIKEHIIYVQQESAFNTDLLINSLNFMQIFIQLNMFLVFWGVYSANKHTTEEEQSGK